MNTGNRLINDFKNQTKATIWKFMNAMAANYSVYSNHLKGYDPYLTGKDIYIFCTHANVVVVCLDCCENGDDQEYEENDHIAPVVYRPGCEPKASRVWKLSKTLQLMKERLEEHYSIATVYGVLLTDATILNAEDLEDFWESNNIKVIDGYTRLKGRALKVNDDSELIGNTYFEALAGDKEAELCRLLKDFIGNSLNNDGKTANTLAKQEPVKDDSPDEDIIPPVVSPDNIVFPGGTIEQNDNVSVKVEILRPIANPREELDKLIGCPDIKHRMDELVALTSYNKMMRKMFPDSKQHEVSLHSVFMGRPGTGKTTVCKIYGSLLREAGALSKGHVVVCNRSTFIGTLWGDEERSVNQVLEKAKGGVLMIDEAYLLNSKNQNDPGRIVINLLMDALADEKRRDFAVVLCGYKEPMMKLLDINPGLRSRFPNMFEFRDFTVDELLEITKTRVKDYEYAFTVKAWEKYRQMLMETYQMRDPETWGNARFVANQLERIYIQHASRCVQQSPKDKFHWLIITPEDIVPIEVPRPKARVGF